MSEMWDYKVWVCQELDAFDTAEDMANYLESILSLDGVNGWELVSTSTVEISKKASLIYHFKKPADV